LLVLLELLDEIDEPNPIDEPDDDDGVPPPSKNPAIRDGKGNIESNIGDIKVTKPLLVSSQATCPFGYLIRKFFVGNL